MLQIMHVHHLLLSLLSSCCPICGLQAINEINVVGYYFTSFVDDYKHRIRNASYAHTDCQSLPFFSLIRNIYSLRTLNVVGLENENSLENN
jgi:hypothetical protein